MSWLFRPKPIPMKHRSPQEVLLMEEIRLISWYGKCSLSHYWQGKNFWATDWGPPKQLFVHVLPFVSSGFSFLYHDFLCFNHFLQVKSQFCSRSSLNAEELGANQSTKLEIASKMMEYVKHENSNETKNKIKRQLWSGSFERKKNEKVSSFLHVFIIIFHFFSFSQGEVPILQQEQPKCWKNSGG